MSQVTHSDIANDTLKVIFQYHWVSTPNLLLPSLSTVRSMTMRLAYTRLCMPPHLLLSPHWTMQHQVHTTHHLLPFVTWHEHPKPTPSGYEHPSSTPDESPAPMITTFSSMHDTLHNNRLNACEVAHTDTPVVKQHTSQTKKVQGEYTPALATPGIVSSCPHIWGISYCHNNGSSLSHPTYAASTSMALRAELLPAAGLSGLLQVPPASCKLPMNFWNFMALHSQ